MITQVTLIPVIFFNLEHICVGFSEITNWTIIGPLLENASAENGTAMRKLLTLCQIGTTVSQQLSKVGPTFVLLS